MTARGKQFVGGILMGAGAMYWLRRDRGEIASTTLAREAMSGRASEAEADWPSAQGAYGARRGDIAGLEAATLEAGRPAGSRRGVMARRALGGALVVFSLFRRNRVGRIARVLGLRLLVPPVARGWRAAMRAAPPVSAAPSERRQIVDIQKSLHVEAPVDRVYAFWSNYENFPLFMPSVREVQDLGGGRSRWSVHGPGGAPLSWTARLTERQRNTAIAWRSEPGAMLEHAGVVRFHPEGTGTRIDFRFCYRSPAGKVGQAASELLGADPRVKLNENLGRLKTLLEATVRSETHGQESGA